jgi:hypothetical protein
MKNLANRGVVSLLALALAAAMGCAAQAPGDDGTGDEPTAEATQAVTASFQASCFNTRVSRNSQPVQAIVDAWADGSISGAQHWSGLCFTDVSNCDGRLVCQNHCP